MGTRLYTALVLTLLTVFVLGCLASSRVVPRNELHAKRTKYQKLEPEKRNDNGDRQTKVDEEERLQTPYSFEDIFDPDLRPQGYDATWLTDNTYTYRANDDGNIYEFDLDTLEEALLMQGQVLDDLSSGTYFVSPDGDFILIAVNRTRVWRHSFTAVYNIYNVLTRQLLDFPGGSLSGEVLQYAGWTTTGRDLSFVYGNNLYYQDSPQGVAQQVTTSGVQPYLFNGIPDWVYEEDVLGSNVGHHFSPNAEYLAYVEYNDTDIPLQSWPYYGSKDDVYGELTQITYPKAGNTTAGGLGPISRVRIYAVSVDDLDTKVELIPPPEIYNPEGFYYYTRLAWLNDSQVFVFWTNRAQNYSVTVLYDATDGSANNNLQQTVQGGWIDSPSPDPWFISDGSEYLTIMPREVGTTGTWPHVALVTAPLMGEGVVRFLSDGEQQVIGISGYDEEAGVVYYISTAGDPTERHIYRANISGEGSPQCMTCDFPSSCRYISATFSPTGQYYIERCGGPGIPQYRLKDTGGMIDVDLENNSDVQARLDEKELPGRFFTDVDLGNGYIGKAEYFIPFGYTGVESYPLLVYVYGGPNSQRVTKSYNMASNTNNWLTYMKSTHKVVVASIDGRGASAYGDRHRFEMYRRVTPVGVEDQLFGARWFRDRDFVDSSQNSAIFGWSYGGFMASELLAESSEAEYQCGMSVAPVTTFRYYDSAYTERYLAFDLPEDNEAGYNDTDVLKKAAMLRDKAYLLAHGTNDDNVHFMHMTQLVRALVEEEVQFRQLMYVDEDHGIGSPNQARHLYRALTDFLLNDCWSTS